MAPSGSLAGRQRHQLVQLIGERPGQPEAEGGGFVRSVWTLVDDPVDDAGPHQVAGADALGRRHLRSMAGIPVHDGAGAFRGQG